MRAGYNDDDASNVFIPYHQPALAFHRSRSGILLLKQGKVLFQWCLVVIFIKIQCHKFYIKQSRGRLHLIFILPMAMRVGQKVLSYVL